MAVVLGTNSGFVSVAPTANPAGITQNIDTFTDVVKDTSPSTAVRITEVGWYCSNATQAANFEVGLYAADGAVVPGEAGTLLFSNITNAKGTGAGWKKVTVDWAISPSTVYWIGVQVDSTATRTQTQGGTSGGVGRDQISAATLPNPFGGGTFNATSLYAIYALWQASNSNFLQFFGPQPQQ